MKRTRKHICVIGLGKFGRELALNLAEHCEVLAIDHDEETVNGISNDVQRALCLDARDANSLYSVLTDDFDEVVVCTGASRESSILCTLHVKRLGIPVIRAKADNEDHAEILRQLGATQIIFPERETAQRVAKQIVNPNLLDFIPLGEDYLVMDVVAPADFFGYNLVQLELRSRYGLFVIAVKKPVDGSFIFFPGPDYTIVDGDVLVMTGKEQDLHKVAQMPQSPARKRK